MYRLIQKVCSHHFSCINGGRGSGRADYGVGCNANRRQLEFRPRVASLSGEATI